MFAKSSLIFAGMAEGAALVYSKTDFEALTTKICADVNTVKVSGEALATTTTHGIKDLAKAAAAANTTDAKAREWLCGSTKHSINTICEWKTDTCKPKAVTKAVAIAYFNSAVCHDAALSTETKCDEARQVTMPADGSAADANLKQLLTGISHVEKDKTKILKGNTCQGQPASYLPLSGVPTATSLMDQTKMTATSESLCTKKGMPYGQVCKWTAGSAQKCGANLTDFSTTSCTLTTYSGEDPCTTTTSTTAAPSSSSSVRSLSALLAGLSMVGAAVMV